MPNQIRQSAAAEILAAMTAILADGIEDERERRLAQALRDFCERRLDALNVTPESGTFSL